MESTPEKGMTATVSDNTLRLESKAASMPSRVLMFVPDAVQRRRDGLKPRFNQRPRPCRSARVVKVVEIVYPEEDPLAKPDAWFDASEPAELSEEEFVRGLPADEWEWLKYKRQEHFNDRRDWLRWMWRMEAARKVKSAPWKISQSEGFSFTPLMRLRQDFIEDPSKYFKDEKEQLRALADLEADIMNTADRWRLNAMRMEERQAALPVEAARKIQKAWATHKEVSQYYDELEEALDMLDKLEAMWD